MVKKLKLTVVMLLTFLALGFAFLGVNSLATVSAEENTVQPRAATFNGFPLDDYTGYEKFYSNDKVLSLNDNLTVFPEIIALNDCERFSYSMVLSTSEKSTSQRQYCCVSFGKDTTNGYRGAILEINFDTSYNYIMVALDMGSSRPVDKQINLPSSDRVVGVECRVTESGFYVYWKGVRNEGGKIYECLKSNDLTHYNAFCEVFTGGVFLSKESYDGQQDANSTYSLVEKGSAYRMSATPVPLPDPPTKEGYTFVGWYYGKGDQGHDSCRAYDNAPIFEDTDLHAHWQINLYTVIYDCAGGLDIDSTTLEYGVSAPTPEPTRVGYRFMGWKLADGTPYNGEGVTGNIILYASWEVITFEVNFYVDNELYAQKTVEYGSTLGVLEGVAQSMNLQMLSVRCGETFFDENSIVTDNCFVDAVKLSESGETMNKNILFLTLGGVAGVVVLISLVGILASSAKRLR